MSKIILMKEIRKWYNKAYREMVVGIDISDEQDICGYNLVL